MNNEESIKAKQGQGMSYYEKSKNLNDFKEIEIIIDPKNQNMNDICRENGYEIFSFNITESADKNADVNNLVRSTRGGREGNMENFTEEQLKECIEKDYGFKKELIMNPVLSGLWHIHFEVNGIKYYGYTAHSGALPELSVEGYTTKYFDNFDTPVTEEYFNKYIKDAKIILRHYKGDGAWEDMKKTFESQAEAKEYISKLDNPKDYQYDFVE